MHGHQQAAKHESPKMMSNMYNINILYPIWTITWNISSEKTIFNKKSFSYLYPNQSKMKFYNLLNFPQLLLASSPPRARVSEVWGCYLQVLESNLLSSHILLLSHQSLTNPTRETK